MPYIYIYIYIVSYILPLVSYQIVCTLACVRACVPAFYRYFWTLPLARGNIVARELRGHIASASIFSNSCATTPGAFFDDCIFTAKSRVYMWLYIYRTFSPAYRAIFPPISQQRTRGQFHFDRDGTRACGVFYYGSECAFNAGGGDVSVIGCNGTWIDVEYKWLFGISWYYVYRNYLSGWFFFLFYFSDSLILIIVKLVHRPKRIVIWCSLLSWFCRKINYRESTVSFNKGGILKRKSYKKHEICTYNLLNIHVKNILCDF